jgi:hypothetical protein
LRDVGTMLAEKLDYAGFRPSFQQLLRGPLK